MFASKRYSWPFPLVALLPLLLATLAEAAPRKFAVVASGECSDLSAQTTRRLRRALETTLGDRLLDEAATASLGAARPLDAPAVQARIEAAHAQFLNLRADEARRQLEAITVDLERLEPGPGLWEAFWKSRAYLARIDQFQGQGHRAGERLAEIARSDETFTLSGNQFPPSTKKLFTQARERVAAARHFPLQLDAPSGTSVYVNGRRAGVTPFALTLTEGRYRLDFERSGRRALTRDVTLKGPLTLAIALDQESRYRPDRGPCLASNDSADPVRDAVTLGRHLEVDRLLLVSQESPDAPTLLSLIDVGTGQELWRTQEPAGRRISAATLTPALEKGTAPSGSGGALAEAKPPVPTATTASGAVAPRPAPPSTSGARKSSNSTSGSSLNTYVAIGLTAVAAGLAGLALYENNRIGIREKRLASLSASGTIDPSQEAQASALRRDIHHAETLRLVSGIGAGAAAVGAGVFFILPSGTEKGPGITIGYAGSF